MVTKREIKASWLKQIACSPKPVLENNLENSVEPPKIPLGKFFGSYHICSGINCPWIWKCCLSLKRSTLTSLLAKNLHDYQINLLHSIYLSFLTFTNGGISKIWVFKILRNFLLILLDTVSLLLTPCLK